MSSITTSPTASPETGGLSRDGKLFIESIAAVHGALLWRQGEWHILCGTGAAVVVSRRRNKMIKSLVEAGALVEHEDGTLRPGAQAAKAILNRKESPLHAVLDGQLLDYFDSAQKHAADRLRTDFERAQLSPRVVARYAPTQGSESRHHTLSDNAILDLSDNTLEARHRVHKAMEAVGPELASILYHVCCLAAGMEQAERQLQMPRRAGKAVLALALTRLARHYGLKKPLRHSGPTHIGHWALADFRPEIAPAQHQL